eukprot:2670955-Rhodomonas_salina.6
MPFLVLSSGMVLRQGEVSKRERDWLYVRTQKVLQLPIALRAPYAMSGTDVAYAAVCLRACCAMCGAGIAYDVRSCYAEC